MARRKTERITKSSRKFGASPFEGLACPPPYVHGTGGDFCPQCNCHCCPPHKCNDVRVVFCVTVESSSSSVASASSSPSAPTCCDIGDVVCLNIIGGVNCECLTQTVVMVFDLGFDLWQGTGFGCITTSSSAPSCPSSICITISGVTETEFCTGCSSFNNSFFLTLVSCEDGIHSFYTGQVDGACVPFTLNLEMYWVTPTYNGGTPLLQIIDDEGVVWYNSGDSGFFPITLTAGGCSSLPCQICDAVISVGSCGEACDCTPPDTLSAQIIDWGTGDCSACLDVPITLTRSGATWVGSGTWCGFSITLTYDCTLGTLSTTYSGGELPEEGAECSPFNAIFLLNVGACMAFVQVTQ